MPLIIVAILYLIWTLVFAGCSAIPKRLWTFGIFSLWALFANYLLALVVVVIYWEFQVAFATSDVDLNRVVASDGASLVFMGIVGGPVLSLIQAAISTCVFFLARSRRSKIPLQGNSVSVELPAKGLADEDYRNPYKSPT